MANWNYGDAFRRHPVENGIIVFENGSKLKTHDIFNPLPDFMKEANIIFVDPPWNQGNLSSFYTKADMMNLNKYKNFYIRLFDCIREINAEKCYIEIGKVFLAEFITELKKIYPKVTFFNSTYYHKKEHLCYVIYGGKKRCRFKLDGMDEEDIIKYICENEEYSCIGDLCMGRGLVATYATKAGKKFVGTELNHKRLAVCVENISNLMSYKKEGGERSE